MVITSRADPITGAHLQASSRRTKAGCFTSLARSAVGHSTQLILLAGVPRVWVPVPTTPARSIPGELKIIATRANPITSTRNRRTSASTIASGWSGMLLVKLGLEPSLGGTPVEWLRAIPICAARRLRSTANWTWRAAPPAGIILCKYVIAAVRANPVTRAHLLATDSSGHRGRYARWAVEGCSCHSLLTRDTLPRRPWVRRPTPPARRVAGKLEVEACRAVPVARTYVREARPAVCRAR
mmetsp:Transcript_30158/g.83215  ORF Transcript_30158/g.83215 Transcript_30158/m.83215 type:complete len:240 (-) Transcript_30158:267-986(-)